MQNITGAWLALQTTRIRKMQMLNSRYVSAAGIIESDYSLWGLFQQRRRYSWTMEMGCRRISGHSELIINYFYLWSTLTSLRIRLCKADLKSLLFQSTPILLITSRLNLLLTSYISWYWEMWGWGRPPLRRGRGSKWLQIHLQLVQLKLWAYLRSQLHVESSHQKHRRASKTRNMGHCRTGEVSRHYPTILQVWLSHSQKSNGGYCCIRPRTAQLIRRR